MQGSRRQCVLELLLGVNTLGVNTNTLDARLEDTPRGPPLSGFIANRHTGLLVLNVWHRGRPGPLVRSPITRNRVLSLLYPTVACPQPQRLTPLNTTAGHAFRPYGHAFTLSPLAWERNAGRPGLPLFTPLWLSGEKPPSSVLKSQAKPSHAKPRSQARHICKPLRAVCGVMRTTL